jgi:hypothetical protein
MMVAHCASITPRIRLGTAVVVLPLYNPARLAAEIETADALERPGDARHRRRLSAVRARSVRRRHRPKCRA